MKKRLRPAALALTLAILAGGAYAAFSDDSLVTLSYLREKFFPSAIQAGQNAADSLLQETYDVAKKELEQVHGMLNGGAVSNGGQYSNVLGSQEWYEGQRIRLDMGDGVLMLRGTASISHNGAVVDVSEGKELQSGSFLEPGHRYLVGEDTEAEVSVLSGYAELGVQGDWYLSGQWGDSAPFLDVKRSDWYYEAVNYVYNNQFFSGMGDHTFSPDATMNRAMLMTVLYQMAGAPKDELESAQVSLNDVPDHAWYAPYVKWGVAQGIASGTGNGGFTPEGQVTREQVVVMLHSFASKYTGQSVKASGDLSGYADHGLVSSWAVQAMSWAVEQGVISGSADGEQVLLVPQGNASRAQVAAMLRSFSEKI